MDMLSITACSHAGGVAPRRVQNSTRSTSSSSFRNGRSTNSGGRTNNGRNRSSSIIRLSSSRAWAHSAPQMMLYLALGCSILLPSFPGPGLRCTTPRRRDVRFLASLGSAWRPSATLYVLFCCRCWARKEVPVLKCTICWRCLGLEGVAVLSCTVCCRCLGLEVGSRWQDVRFVAGVLDSKWGPVPMRRRTFCCL